jgi:hypothetical protein
VKAQKKQQAGLIEPAQNGLDETTGQANVTAKQNAMTASAIIT